MQITAAETRAKPGQQISRLTFLRKHTTRAYSLSLTFSSFLSRSRTAHADNLEMFEANRTLSRSLQQRSSRFRSDTDSLGIYSDSVSFRYASIFRYCIGCFSLDKLCTRIGEFKERANWYTNRRFHGLIAVHPCARCLRRGISLSLSVSLGEREDSDGETAQMQRYRGT